MLFPPFEPDRDEPKRRRFRPIPVRTLVPNLITLLALCAGLTAVRLAIEGKLEFALAAIVLAAVLDGIDGRIERMVYRAGKFLNADLDKASEDNERNALVIDAAGTRIGLVQIAGLIARRIVPFVREGDAIGAGERIGMIRFGSRVDLYLPDDARLRVGQGQIARCRARRRRGDAGLPGGLKRGAARQYR